MAGIGASWSLQDAPVKVGSPLPTGRAEVKKFCSKRIHVLDWLAAN
jgi:hypothetical protein